MLSLYTVCFFGHRRIDDIISVENSVENVIRCGDNNEYHWTELYTKEEKDRFAAALQ